MAAMALSAHLIVAQNGPEIKLSGSRMRLNLERPGWRRSGAPTCIARRESADSQLAVFPRILMGLSGDVRGGE
jgi:hypothetical protein